MRSAPDGHMLLAATPANTVNATLYDRLNFNFIRDIAPVAGILTTPSVMLVHPAIPRKSGSHIHRLCQGQSGQDQHGVGR